ncbi:uncharacterized protein LOC128300648 [Anopheles moucheti]|uniref:uncharacterized protein LOC128300648 n=1 Tax=Anopheles moucheti TaxID=186751 RepID=UPI0022EFDCCA|nr:uncharacterized protein LOC128300648 [Anopheles moucheti]
MITTLITFLSVGSFLLVNAGKLAYYNDRLPALEPVPVSYYWPNEDVLAFDEPDAIHYPAWFQLPWRPISLQQPVLEEDPIEKHTLPPATESPPVTTTEDDTPEGRHLHQKKTHKHKHHHKYKQHQHDKAIKSAGFPVDVSDELQYANVGQLKMVILQLEHKLQELKLQLFGSRTLTSDATIDDTDDTARAEDESTNGDHEAYEKMEQTVEDASRVLTDITSTSAEKDEGKLLLEENNKPATELELEHRKIEANPFDNGRSLTENVQKWFEGLDLGKIAALPLEESVESEDVSGTIDVRGNFNKK